MKVFVTGARGFVGRWLTAELEHNGHQVVGIDSDGDGRRVDVTSRQELADILHAVAPDAIVHLAAVSSQPAAADDPETALQVNVGGTLNLIEQMRGLERAPALLVTGSSEVYGAPAPTELPLTEASPLRPRSTYALTKAAQESVALAYAQRLDLPVVVTRSFNHTGPGQRPDFVIPALAHRVLDVQMGNAADIPVGNTHVRRDFSDVRDVVLAYRLLLEALDSGRIGRGGRVVNVCSGEAVSIGRIVELLCEAAEVEPRTRVVPDLVRPHEAPEIRGDPSTLRSMVDWHPLRRLDETLRDVWRSMVDTPSATPPAERSRPRLEPTR